MAALKPPEYSVYIVSGITKYNVTKAVTSLERSEPEGQLAQRVTIQLANVKVGDEMIASKLNARDRIFIYANDGEKEAEVFRGFLWTRVRSDSIKENEVKYVCYDNLIYFQESEDSLYFASGKSTKDVVAAICEKWGIALSYSYSSIVHSKLPLRGTLADIITDDILDPVKKQKKVKYVIQSKEDTMIVKPAGLNSTLYQFSAGKNIIKTASGWTMDGVVTQVIVTGKADDDDREPIEATLRGNTSKYGTLQRILRRSEGTTLEEAKLEAQSTIDENGAPKWEYEITCPDIPWLRRGDKIRVNAGGISGKKIITEIDRTADSKTREMTLTLEDE